MSEVWNVKSGVWTAKRSGQFLDTSQILNLLRDLSSSSTTSSSYHSSHSPLFKCFFTSKTAKAVELSILEVFSIIDANLIKIN